MKNRIALLLTLVSATSWLVGCAGPGTHRPSDTRLTNLAAELGRKGDTTSAIALYERAAQAMPDKQEVWLSLGHAHLRNDDPRSATLAFQQAYRLQPNNPQSLLGLGQAALMQAKPQRANELIAKATNALHTAPAYNLLGISLLLQHDMDLAIPAFQRAQQLAPDNLELQANEALAYALAGQSAAAVQTIEKVTTSPLAQAPHTRRAVLILMLAGKDQQALAVARELPESERASLIERSAGIRKLPSVESKMRAMGMTAMPDARYAP